jgi:hypothetical protein
MSSKKKALDHFKFPSWNKQRGHLKKSGASEHNLRIEDRLRKAKTKDNPFPRIGDILKREGK